MDRETEDKETDRQTILLGPCFSSLATESKKEGSIIMTSLKECFLLVTLKRYGIKIATFIDAFVCSLQPHFVLV